jgi:glycerol-3-phosphate dehydrogenase subunit B
MSALELDCDNVIVGGGIAGLAASMRLTGKTILLSGGLGATALSGGVLSPLAGDAEAEDWFLGSMEGSVCRYVRGRCVSISQAYRHGLVQDSVSCDGAPTMIAVNEERPGFKSIDFLRGCSFQEMARILETEDEAVDELSRSLSGMDGDRILLPPILGILRTNDLRDRLKDITGIEVGEYVISPSVLGLRLISALRKKASENKRLDMLDIVTVERIVGGRVEGRMGTKGKREIAVAAGNLFIATGGILTGLQAEGDRLFEPLTGAAVSMDFEADLNREFLSGHPLMYKGIAPDLYIHGFDNVRVIGAASRGFGLYEAMVSGYRAGDGLE